MVMWNQIPGQAYELPCGESILDQPVSHSSKMKLKKKKTKRLNKTSSSKEVWERPRGTAQNF